MIQFIYPEGATPLDQDELNDLIPSHITTQSELNEWELKNILEAKLWCNNKKDILTLQFIPELHKQMFNQTWKWAGKFRTSNKNIGNIHWPYVTNELKKLCDDVEYQIINKTYHNDEVAVRLHQRLTWIHPFPNGNGRYARLITDLFLNQIGEKKFNWKNLDEEYKPNEIRKEYINALRNADNGDCSKLLIFVRS